MNYEKFLKISEALFSFIEENKMVFASFGHCVSYKIISEKDIDHYRELKHMSKKINHSHSNYIEHMQILVCMIIILRYPNEIFENCKSDRTLVRYLTDRHWDLLSCAKTLHNYMNTF